MTAVNRFGDGLAVEEDVVSAADTAVREALAPLDGQVPDLLCVFVSHEDPEQSAEAGRRAMSLAGARTSIGCSAGGVIGAGRGVEMKTAVAAWAAVLPDVRLDGFNLEAIEVPEGVGIGGIPPRRDDDAVAILLVDPFTFPATQFIDSSGDVLGGLPLVGGLGYGQRGPGSTRLFLNGEVTDSGAVGVVLGGGISARTLVSQGCRPIGPTMIVTRARGNVLLEIAGTPAYAKLEEIIRDLPSEDQNLAMRGLHIGIAMDEYADEHERGDFLIRGVVGADRDQGAIAVGTEVEIGQTVRFQVRDAAAAHEELDTMLDNFRADGDTDAALLFSCNGRGAGLFESADHDVLALRSGLGISQVAGFFAAGEIGPVAGRNHLHGFTASVLAFGR